MKRLLSLLFLCAFGSLLPWAQAATSYQGQTPTTTTLTAAPSGSTGTRSIVTLTATVSPAAEGTVNFFDADSAANVIDALVLPNLIGTAQTVGGVAVLHKPLVYGAHNLYATFTGNEAYGASTSTQITYSVVAATPPNLQTSANIFLSGGPDSYSVNTVMSAFGTLTPQGALQLADQTTGAPLRSIPLTFSNGFSPVLAQPMGTAAVSWPAYVAVADLRHSGQSDLIVDGANRTANVLRGLQSMRQSGL